MCLKKKFVNTIFMLLLAFLLNLVSSVCFAVAGGLDENVTIFIYHKFAEQKYPTTNVSAENFAEQLAYLQANNYQVLSLVDLIDLLERKKGLPAKTAVITVDDGYTSTYTVAWPLLKKYGYPFTVFLYVEAVNREYRNFLTWAQIKEMRESGVDFQDHTYSHYRLAKWPPGLDEQKYRQWINSDLSKGRKILADNLGYVPMFLALPYGEYNNIVLDEAAKVGYRSVFTQDPGSVSSETDALQVPREPILGNDWSTLSHFENVLKRYDLPFKDRLPPIKPLVDSSPSQFCASLVYPERYNPKSLEIYVSELGWQKGELSQNRLCVPNRKALQRRSNRVAVRATLKEDGSRAIRYWLLIQ